MSARGTASRAATDVIVVGGGVIGLAIAERLARDGKRVAVFDRRRPGGEASWAAGGMLAAEYEFETAGPAQMLAFESRRMWPEFAARMLADYATDVRLRRDGTLVPAPDEPALARLHARLDGRPFGGRVEWLDAKSALEKEPSLSPGLAGAAWLRDDLVCENRALLFALLRAARKLDVTLHAESPASIWLENGVVRGVIAERAPSAGGSPEGGRSEPEGRARAEGSGERFEAGLTINAAGAWASTLGFAPDPAPARHPVVRPVRGQMLGYLAAPKDSLRHVVRWDGGYAIPRGDGRIVVGATVEPDAGFAKAVTPDGASRMASGLAAALPGLVAERKHAWSGLRPASADGLPLLGSLPGVKNYLLATGHYRNGILLTPITAEHIAELAGGRGRPAAWLSAFSPDRASVARDEASTLVVNGAPRRWTPGLTVRALLAELLLERPGVAVAVNEEVVRRGDWEKTLLSKDDHVEIIHAVGGG